MYCHSGAKIINSQLPSFLVESSEVQTSKYVVERAIIVPFTGESELLYTVPYPVSITLYPEGILELENETLYLPSACLDTERMEVIDFPSHQVPLIEAPELVPLILPIASIRGCLPFAPEVTKSVHAKRLVISHLPFLTVDVDPGNSKQVISTIS